MAAARLPGVLGMVTGATLPESGPGESSHVPGPRGGERNALTAYDRDLIESQSGKDIGGKIRPLRELLGLADEARRRAQEAAVRDGTDSWIYRWERARFERLDALIAEAQSPAGRAYADVEALLADVPDPSRSIDERKIQERLATVLQNEAQRQKRGADAVPGRDTGDLLERTLHAFGTRYAKIVRKTIDDYKRPGSQVSDDQLREALGKMLGNERQIQLLGIESDASTGDLMIDALDAAEERHSSNLQKLLDRAKSSPATVTPQQLQEAVAVLLGDERQRQLMGASESKISSSIGKLLGGALDAGREVHVADLQRLLDRAKTAPAAVTQKQIQEAVAALLGDERQRQLLGMPETDATPRIDRLLEEASNVLGKGGGPSDPPVHGNVEIGTPRIGPRR